LINKVTSFSDTKLLERFYKRKIQATEFRVRREAYNATVENDFRLSVTGPDVQADRAQRGGSPPKTSVTDTET
jgi:hypothetical protein